MSETDNTWGTSSGVAFVAGKSEVPGVKSTWGNILLLDFFWFSRDSVESTEHWCCREN